MPASPLLKEISISPINVFINFLFFIFSEMVISDKYLGCMLQIKNSYFLVSMVDNDYIHGDLFTVFSGL